MSWIRWKGIHSDAMPIVVSRYPDIIRPEERIESIQVPGRTGEFFLQTGEPVYDAYVKECECYLRPEVDIGRVAHWLTGAGMVVFGNEPEYAYEARIINQVPFEQMMRGRAHRRFIVPFFCQPLKRLVEVVPDIIVTETLAPILNPGHVISRPRIKVEGSGDIIIMIGTESITHITGMVEPLIIDSELGLATDATMTKNASYLVSVDWPRIPVGTSAISFSGNVSKITITPRWRYL